MKETRFDLIARLLRSGAQTSAAAKLVLVEGLLPSVAAREAKISSQSCSNTVARFRETHDEICDVFSAKYD